MRLILVFLIWASSASLVLACMPAPTDAPTKSTAPVHIKIGDTFFSVPENFILHPQYRIPGDVEQFQISFYMPALRPVGNVRESNQVFVQEDPEWRKENPFFYVMIMSEKSDSLSNNRSTLYPLTPKVMYSYSGGSHPEINSSSIKKLLDSFILKDKPEGWDQTVHLASSLRANRRGNADACRYFMPSADGKPVSRPLPPPPIEMQIIREGLKHSSQEIRRAALLRLAEHKDKLPEVLVLLEQAALNDSVDHVRASAVTALASLKTDAAAAMNTLLSVLEKDSSDLVVRKTGDAITAIGVPDVGRLKKILVASGGQRQYASSQILAWLVTREIREKKLISYDQLSPEATKALAVLAEGLQVMEPEPASNVMNIVSSPAAASPEYVSAVLSIMQNKDSKSRSQAASTLGRMAPDAKESVPALIEILKADEINLYQTAIEALSRYKADAHKAVPLLVNLSQFACEGVEYGNNQMSPPPAPDFFTPGYVHKNGSPKPQSLCTADKIKWIRSRSIMALGQIGVATPEALSVVLNAQSDKDHQVRFDAINAYTALEKDRPKLISRLVDLLESQDSATVSTAMRALASLGKEALPAIEHLSPMLNNLMMLAPDIISAILTGTQPATLHLQDLTANLPVEWQRQMQLLKFPARVH